MLTLTGSPQLLIFGFIHVCWPGRPIFVISSSGQEVTAEDHIIRQLWKGTTVCREGQRVLCALRPWARVRSFWRRGHSHRQSQSLLVTSLLLQHVPPLMPALNFPILWETERNRCWTWLSSFEGILTSLLLQTGDHEHLSYQQPPLPHLMDSWGTEGDRWEVLEAGWPPTWGSGTSHLFWLTLLV